MLLNRIRKRGRKEEQNIPIEFLIGLNGYYSAFPQSVTNKYDAQVMTFDVTHFDIHDPAQAEAFLALTEAFVHSAPSKAPQSLTSQSRLN